MNWGSDTRMGENTWPKDVRLMMRTGEAEVLEEEAAVMSLGRIRLVKRKWPRWFVANCISCPSSLRVRVWIAMTPALLIRMSMDGMSVEWLSSEAAVRTERKDERSIWRNL